MFTVSPYLGQGEEKACHNVFIIYPSHNQQAVNYQAVTYTAVAYVAYMGNCYLNKTSGMIFPWLAVCLDVSMSLVLCQSSEAKLWLLGRSLDPRAAGALVGIRGAGFLHPRAPGELLRLRGLF